MKLIIRESVNAIAEPVKKIFQVRIDQDSFGKISRMIGLAKGDIIVFRGPGDPVRLEAGSDGQVLVTDSTSELGVRWVDVDQIIPAASDSENVETIPDLNDGEL